MARFGAVVAPAATAGHRHDGVNQHTKVRPAFGRPDQS
jgi:hypothetical protein